MAGRAAAARPRCRPPLPRSDHGVSPRGAKGRAGRRLPPARRVAAACLAILWTAGCGPDPGIDPAGTTRCDVGWGELAITEILSNPIGPDAGAEWFEIVNLSGRHLALNGLTLEVGSPVRPRTHRILEALDPGLAPNAHLTIGNGVHGEPTAGYAWPQMNLPNAGGAIAIRCDDTVVDRVEYGLDGVPVPAEGRSVQLSASVLDDPLSIPGEANDAGDAWCPVADETAPYDAAGNRGTPGTANPRCPIPGTCRDGDDVRPARTPGPGDATFSEVYADTPGADDPLAEWVEIRVHRAFDLAGLVLEHATATGRRTFPIPEMDCNSLAAGSLAVLGASDDPSRNGGVEGMFVVFPAGLTLYNGDASLVLRTGNGTEISRSAHPGARTGVSIGFDTDRQTWCAQRQEGRFQGVGTPGRENDACGEDG